jgi:hypothetical protein
MVGCTLHQALWAQARATSQSAWPCLGIIFKSVGLPEQYPVARFVMWLSMKASTTPCVAMLRKLATTGTKNWTTSTWPKACMRPWSKPSPISFTSAASCVETLNNLYPYVQDVSSGDMLKAIRQALTRDGKFPLTLVVLDEVQQYIGEDSQRSIDVQEVVEACCKNIGAKMLFIGTGQTAVTGTSNLKKLEGRFTVRVELSDADVDAVIRK